MKYFTILLKVKKKLNPFLFKNRTNTETPYKKKLCVIKAKKKSYGNYSYLHIVIYRINTVSQLRGVLFLIYREYSCV